jgi:hypothetical protein
VNKGGERFIQEGRDGGRQDWVVLHYKRGVVGVLRKDVFECCARTSSTVFLNVRKVSRRVRGLVSGDSTFRWKRAAVFVRSLVSLVTFLKCARLRLLLLVGFFLWRALFFLWRVFDFRELRLGFHELELDNVRVVELALQSELEVEHEFKSESESEEEEEEDELLSLAEST